MQFIAASHNQNKVRELQRIFRMDGHEVIPYTQLTSKKDFPVEGTKSYEENAVKKALYISGFLPEGLIIADDSGLLLTARPEILGVRTARDLANYPRPHLYAQHISHLVRGTERAFTMQTSIACARQGKIIKVANGILRGQVATSERETDGEGFSRILIPYGSTKTLAQMNFKEHFPYLTRARATKKLLNALKENND